VSTPPGTATLLAWPLAGWLGGMLLTAILERLVQPAGGRWSRGLPAWAIHAGLWTLAYSALLVIVQRPFFAAAIGSAGALLVVLVNNAKFRALREPFLFSDFGLFSQALRHPRLYLPFLGIGRALAGVAAFAAALYLGIRLEPGLPAMTGTATYLVVTCSGLLLGAGLLALGSQRAPSPTLQPVRDLRELGLAASLWLYWRMERSDAAVPAAATAAQQADWTPPALFAPAGSQPPHIVAVQSESFFDARRLSAAVRPGLLRAFDRARAASMLHGRLEVPAWGANTMRTEFGFLTGIDADRLGVHRFNPYRRFARKPIPSLASRLRAIGYRTLCIHPHPASFFARDQVYPQLGFDRFIDICAFDRNDRCGPYICDRAVSDMIGEILDSATQPTFVFAITMENHGPLHLEQVAAGDAEALYVEPPPAGCEDLTVYLRHLRNADRMLDALIADLGRQARQGVLCWFGDHVPSMPGVYAAAGYDDGHTDYLVWRGGSETPFQRGLRVEQLGDAVLAAAGLQRD
jgi:hypothetical protein